MTPHRLVMHWGSLKVVAQNLFQSETSLQLAAALSEQSCTLPYSGPAATMRYSKQCEGILSCMDTRSWTISWKCSHDVLMINWTVKITCNPLECYRGVVPACQGRYPSPRPARVLLVSSRARYGAARNSHRKELGWLCYHRPPCAQGDALEGPPNMWGIVSTAEMDRLLIKLHVTYFYISLPSPTTVTTVNPLETRKTREEWENIFNQNYIQPILRVPINLC